MGQLRDPLTEEEQVARQKVRGEGTGLRTYMPLVEGGIAIFTYWLMEEWRENMLEGKSGFAHIVEIQVFKDLDTFLDADEVWPDSVWNDMARLHDFTTAMMNVDSPLNIDDGTGMSEDEKGWTG